MFSSARANEKQAAVSRAQAKALGEDQGCAASKTTLSGDRMIQLLNWRTALGARYKSRKQRYLRDLGEEKVQALQRLQNAIFGAVPIMIL